MNVSSSITISDWLRKSEALLIAAGIDTARLDSLVLLADELGCDKAWILAHSDDVLQGSAVKILSTKVTQRATHIPLAYLREKAEFYGREFAVDSHVLVPRPESESIISLLKAFCEQKQPMIIIDVGTGSGALAISAKLEVPNANVIATDIDEACLAVATQNAKQLGATIAFMLGDVLEPMRASKHKLNDSIALANLPYVPDGYAINKAASHEPALALFGGVDGLDYYRELFSQIEAFRTRLAAIITESLTTQHTALQTIAEAAGYILSESDGLAQLYVPHR